jgi:hypothetical protein
LGFGTALEGSGEGPRLGGAEVEERRLRFLGIAGHSYSGGVVLLRGKDLRDVEVKVLLLRMQYRNRYRILDSFP